MAIIVRAVPRSAGGSAEEEAAGLQRTFEEDTPPIGRLVALLPASDASSLLAVYESTESAEFANLSE